MIRDQTLAHALRLGAVLLALAIAATLADAQMPGGGRRGGMKGGGDAQGRATGPTGASAIADQLDAQLEDVRQQLHLQKEQEPAWSAYAERVDALMADQFGRRTPPPAAAENENALRQIDRKVDVVRNRLAAMEDVADAAKALYAKLTPEQQAIADRVLPPTVPALYSSIPSGRFGGAQERRRGGG